MKKFLVSLLMFIIWWSSPVEAQITLNATDFPQIGDQFKVTNDSTSMLLPGSSGENQVWDFRSLVTQDSFFTTVLDPIQTPFADSFPTANQSTLNINGTDTSYSFLLLTQERLVQLGFATSFSPDDSNGTDPQPDDGPIKIDRQVLIAQFPTTFGSTFQDTSEIALSVTDDGGTLILRQSIIRNSTIDAWGTVQLPQGDFDALREQIITTTIDSIFIDLGIPDEEPIFFGGNLSIDTAYSFLAKESKGLLVQFSPKFISDQDTTSTSPFMISYALVEEMETGEAPVADFLFSVGESTGMIDFTDQSTNDPTNWSWNFGDGMGTSTDQNPSYTYQTSGDFNVCLTASNEFGSNETCQTVSIVLTDLKGLPVGTSFRLSSNPFGDHLVVQLTNWNQQPATLRIFNINGQEMFQSPLRDQLEIDAGQWAAGTYIYQLSDQGQVLKTGRILRQ